VSKFTTNDYEGLDLETLADLPNYYNWIVDIFRPWLHGYTLEIGTGIGTITKKIVDHVDHLDCLEPSENLTRLLPRSIIDNPKVSLFADTLEQHLPLMNDGICDNVVMVNVLEHIEDDREAIKQLNRVLKKGGHLLLFVPAIQFLFSELDRRHGHYRRYDLPSLSVILLENGFHLNYQRYFDFAGVLPWFIINTIGKKTGFNPQMVETYDRIVIPITKFFENLIRPPFGKNIIVVAEKITQIT
jgi:SAM-dependent methyltransferase